MGKHKKLDKKLLAERPEVDATLLFIEETKATLEMLKAEKEALKDSLKPKPAVKTVAKKALAKKPAAKKLAKV
jgi:hypothetical protein